MRWITAQPVPPVRYAADGIWLSGADRGAHHEQREHRQSLVERSDQNDASRMKPIESEAAMRYNINARLIYDATDGTLTLPGSDEPDSQLSITASACSIFFPAIPAWSSRDEVLKKSGTITA